MSGVPRFWYGPRGALLCDRAIPDITHPLHGDMARLYDASYYVAEDCTRAACEKIAAAFLPHIPQKFYPADVLGIEIYREGAIRGIGLGALAFETHDEKTGETVLPKLELYRIAINRRSYTNCQMEYVAQTIVDVYKRRESIRYGLRISYAPPVPGIHHFLAHLEPFAV